MKIAALLILLLMPAMARIGESPAECVKRYGKPVATGEEAKRFEKSGLLVTVVFHKGKAAALMISKSEKDALGRSAELSQAEIVALINANCGDLDKIVYPETATETHIETEDHSIIINYQKFSRVLSIATKEWADMAIEKKAQDERDKLKDF